MRDAFGKLACAIALALTCGCAGIAPYHRAAADSTIMRIVNRRALRSAGLVFLGALWSLHHREFALANLALVLVWLLIVIGIGRRHRTFPANGPAPTTTG